MNTQPEPQTAITAKEAQNLRQQIQLAMLCGRLNCALNGSDIWGGIPAAGDCPTPEELIVWAAAEALRRMAAQ